MTRNYKLGRRGKLQEQTRQKIIDAAIDLHQRKGLMATTMTDIAARANVGRVTVYRHFPDDAAMVRACSGKYFEHNPLPDPSAWLTITDPMDRARRGLRDSYAYHASTEAMMTRVYAEARDLPIMEPYHAHWRQAADILASAWPAKPRKRLHLQAAFCLALDFETWRNLVRLQGLSNDQAVEMMLRLSCEHSPADR